MSSPAGKSRLAAAIPNMFTLGNGICGFSAILCAASTLNPSNNSTTCLLCSIGLILLAMVFDALDGWVARKMGTSSDIGAQLDSMCDAVSFGAAPAVLLWFTCAGGVPAFVLWSVGAVYVGCALFRLARFNVQTTDHSSESHRWFTGLPSPAAAAMVLFASAALLLLPPESASVRSQVAWIVTELSLLAALLMVSRRKFPHLSQVIRTLKGRE